jgi:hypothetical protein
MAINVKKLPFLDKLLQTDCTITLNLEGVGRNGEPLEGVTWTGKCIFSEKADRIYDTDGKKVLLLGKVIVKGDIAPDLKNVSSGNITINGATYEIHRGYRPRNPDGTIHHTMFELR